MLRESRVPDVALPIAQARRPTRWPRPAIVDAVLTMIAISALLLIALAAATAALGIVGIFLALGGASLVIVEISLGHHINQRRRR